eukprot:297326_1
MSVFMKCEVAFFCICTIFTICIGCPHEMFKFAADYKSSFKLPPGKLYYVAVGMHEYDLSHWGIGLLTPKAKKNKFKCDRKNLGVGAGYYRRDSSRIKKILKVVATQHTICCYAEAEALARHGILPPKLMTPLIHNVQAETTYRKPGELPAEVTYRKDQFKWFLHKKNRYLSLAHTPKKKKTGQSQKYADTLE